MSDPRTDYVAVIPAYNEVATIHAVAAQTLAHVTRVIVVDDGSDDGTAQALASLPVTLLRNPRNSGKAASLWRGMQVALAHNPRGVLTLDGDGQHRPAQIPRLLDAAARAPDHVVIGARLWNRSIFPPARYRANRVANFWIGLAAGYDIEDSQSGFRVYPASLLRAVRVPHGPARGFVFESEMLIEAARLGYRSLPVRIDTAYRAGARASHFRPVVDIARIVVMVAGKLLSPHARVQRPYPAAANKD